MMKWWCVTCLESAMIPETLKISFVDFEKNNRHCSHHKILYKFIPAKLYILPILFAVKSNDPSLPSSLYGSYLFLNMFSSWIQVKYWSLGVKQYSINQCYCHWKDYRQFRVLTCSVCKCSCESRNCWCPT